MTTTLTTACRERIEALLAVAVHPKVAANAGVTDLYAFRFASIGLAIALNIAAQRLNGNDQ